MCFNVVENRSCFTFIATFSAIIVFLLTMSYHFSYVMLRDGPLTRFKLPVRLTSGEHILTHRRPLIVVWTPYFGHEWSDFKADHCDIIFDQSRAHEADAILFHLRDTNPSDLPQKSINQKWILMNQESPINSGSREVVNLIQNHIDLTMTYKSDSSIKIPYGQIVNKHRNISISIDFSRKSKDIAWFVSNCQTESRRENLVQKLEQLMSVDVYGRCGNHRCPKSSSGQDECYQMLSRDYKFYLSLENSLCDDYVTEKLFNVLRYDVIPVVYGGANYSKILPPNSYIDVQDFTTIQTLVNYLKKVGNDERLYRSYFDWKQSKSSVEVDMGLTLCEYMLKPRNQPKRTKSLYDWWFTGTCHSLNMYF